MGSGMVCGKDQEYDSLGLCYPACEGEWVGVGPACFSKCPVTHEPCAGVLCLPSAVLPAAVLPPHALLHKQSRLLPGPAGEEGLAVMQGDQHW